MLITRLTQRKQKKEARKHVIVFHKDGQEYSRNAELLPELFFKSLFKSCTISTVEKSPEHVIYRVYEKKVYSWKRSANAESVQCF